MKNVFNIFIIFLLIFGCATEDIQESIALRTKIDTTTATIGDVIYYSIFTSGAGDDPIVIREFEQPEAIELRSIAMIDGNSFKMELVFWDTGQFSIPAIDVMFLNADSTIKMTIQTNPQEIVIVSSTDPTYAGKMKPVKDPLPVSKPLDWKRIVIIAILFLALATMIWLSIKYRKEKWIGPPENILPQPDEIAIEKLNALRDSSKENLDLKEFYVQISYILREYVEHSLFVKTLEMTTEEIKSLDDLLPFSEEELTYWMNLLERSDLIKYAKMLPEQHECTQDLSTAEKFIQSTIPYWKRIESPIA